VRRAVQSPDRRSGGGQHGHRVWHNDRDSGRSYSRAVQPRPWQLLRPSWGRWRPRRRYGRRGGGALVSARSICLGHRCGISPDAGGRRGPDRWCPQQASSCHSRAESQTCQTWPGRQCRGRWAATDFDPVKARASPFSHGQPIADYHPLEYHLQERSPLLYPASQ
jgi:hypothetical protein